MALDRDKINVAKASLMARVMNDLTLHPPTSEAVIASMDCLRNEAKSFAAQIVDICPITREQSIALTKIEEALFYAIASLARNQE